MEGINMADINWKAETQQQPEFKGIYPAGTYKVKILTHERVQATTGTEQIRWRAIIEEPDEFGGLSILEHNSITEKSLWKVELMVNLK